MSKKNNITYITDLDFNNFIKQYTLQNQAIIIAGATASGKTNLALRMSEKYNVEIINADSLQLYKNIKTLTACPTILQTQTAPHHLFNIYDNNQNANVYDWLMLVKKSISEVITRGNIPLIVGGTGMYLSSLLKGISIIPKIDANIKDKVINIFNELNINEFYQFCISQDPLIKNKIQENDSQRLLRALEVFLQTNKSIFEFNSKNHKIIDLNFDVVIIMLDRSTNIYNIETRTLDMLKNGAIEEIKVLKEKGVSLNMPVCKAIGVKEIFNYLDNCISFEELYEAINIKTRQYAKRQNTWFRNQFK